MNCSEVRQTMSMIRRIMSMIRTLLLSDPTIGSRVVSIRYGGRMAIAADLLLNCLPSDRPNVGECLNCL